jgi:hypothetical protein
MSRLAEYLGWLQIPMREFNDLMTKYNAFKEKECAISDHVSVKKEKKDTLLRMKECKTITKEGATELEFINKEENIKELYQSNISTVQIRRERELRDAKLAYDAAVTSAEQKYENAMEAYEKQMSASLAKVNREHNAKKNMIDMQRQTIENERILSSKTAAEMTIEHQKRDILLQMERKIKLIEFSKKSTLKESEMDLAPPTPVLPEPIVLHIVPQPSGQNYDYSMLGEDAATLALREEFKAKRREDEREKLRQERERNMSNEGLQRQYAQKYGRTSVYLDGHRPPTVYGPIHVLEKREFKQPAYVPEPVTDEIENDYFTKD